MPKGKTKNFSFLLKTHYENNNTRSFHLDFLQLSK